LTSFTASGKPKRTIESLQVERRFRNPIRLFLTGEMPNFTHQRHVHMANILRHLPFGRELMHLGLQTMAYRHYISDKYSAEITDRYWEQLDGTLPDPEDFDDLPGGLSG
jgi:glycogen synthase